MFRCSAPEDEPEGTGPSCFDPVVEAVLYEVSNWKGDVAGHVDEELDGVDWCGGFRASGVREGRRVLESTLGIPISGFRSERGRSRRFCSRCLARSFSGRSVRALSSAASRCWRTFCRRMCSVAWFKKLSTSDDCTGSRAEVGLTGRKDGRRNAKGKGVSAEPGWSARGAGDAAPACSFSLISRSSRESRSAGRTISSGP